MKTTAKLSYLRIAPRKVRLVADLVRGKTVESAQNILNFSVKKGSLPVLKLLNQAVANAKNNHQLDPANLFIGKITVDEGPKYKRWMPRSRGQAYEIQKKTSHIIIVLDEIKETKGKKKAAVKAKTVAAKEEALASQEKASTAKITEDKPKFKPQMEAAKPKVASSAKRIFRRKAV